MSFDVVFAGGRSLIIKTLGLHSRLGEFVAVVDLSHSPGCARYLPLLSLRKYSATASV